MTSSYQHGRSMMGAVRKLSIALTEELASEVDNAVATGDYASTSEVIRDALRLWRRDRDDDRAEKLRLRRLWEEGLASGEPVEGGFDPEDRSEEQTSEVQSLMRISYAV